VNKTYGGSQKRQMIILWKNYFKERKVVMEALKLTLEVEDSLRATHNLRYSWDNQRSG
jgi:hypothetical protein